MVAYHRPIPEKKRRGPAGDAGEGEGGVGGGILSAWVQAEKMIQIVMVLPSAGFIGWLMGYGLGRWLSQAWMGIAGAALGIVAGLVAAIRMAMVYAGDSDDDAGQKASKASGNPAGGRGNTGDSGKTS